MPRVILFIGAFFLTYGLGSFLGDFDLFHFSHALLIGLSLGVAVGQVIRSLL